MEGCSQLIKWPASWSSGILCRRCNYLMDKIQSLGDGQRMGPIRPSQLTMHNSWDLIVTFEGLVFGKQKRKESISFFAWLLLQCKILTADKLLARRWPCSPSYTLCTQEPETAPHLILHCTFARQVWAKLETWSQNLITIPAQGIDIMEWWEKELANLPKKIR